MYVDLCFLKKLQTVMSVESVTVALVDIEWLYSLKVKKGLMIMLVCLKHV